MKLIRYEWFIVLAIFFGSFIRHSVASGQNSSLKYLFYMHGAWIERHGLHQSHPVHGPYEYDEIVRALAQEGFEVNSEVRGGNVHPVEYATRVADQIRSLLEEGVPPGHLLVAGHSKGGHMALIVASLVREPNISYVVMAGCGKKGTEFRRGYEQFLKQNARDLQGRILSIYDSSDREAGSCQEAFQKAAHLETKEIVLHTGQGHGLFYFPQAVWIREIFQWASMKE